MSHQENLKVLNDYYYNLDNPAAFSSIRTLYDQLNQSGNNIKKRIIGDWLRGQQTHTLHKDRRLKFKRKSYSISNIDDLWETDLIDMQYLSRKNGGNKYILAVIDCFSKFGWCVPIKRKTPSEIIRAFTLLFSSTNRRPVCIQSDKGREFNNKTFKSYLISKDINYKTTKDPKTKASICERFIRTIKSIIFKYFTFTKKERYIDIIDSIAHVYNTRKHTTIGMAPVHVNEENVLRVWKFMKSKKNYTCWSRNIKFEIGDLVRVANPKKIFDKGYRPKWSEEIFCVSKCIQGEPIVYRICDLDSTCIDGDFYEYELQKIIA